MWRVLVMCHLYVPSLCRVPRGLRVSSTPRRAAPPPAVLNMDAGSYSAPPRLSLQLAPVGQPPGLSVLWDVEGSGVFPGVEAAARGSRPTPSADGRQDHRVEAGAARPTSPWSEKDVFRRYTGRTRACTGATHVPGTWNVLQLIVISWMGTSRLEGIKQSRGLMAGERPPGEGVGDAEPRNSYVAHGDPSPDP
ncbi:unnamed protein product [Boreogadus saida]